MASIHYLQQISCNIPRHTLIMLLHYLGKLKRFKFAANIELTKQNALIFACTYINGSCILTYYFSLWFLLNMVPVKYSLK